MKFAVVGAGGVGGYFGARLAAAGHEVAFIARGAHRHAMERKGLRILSSKGDLHIAAPRVHGDPEAAGPCDFVLLCVKMADTAAAAEAIGPILADGAAVVSLQNGVEAEDMLAAVLGRPSVMGGVAYIASHIAEPGVVRHDGETASLAFGELESARSTRQEALRTAFVEAGVDARSSADIDVRVWLKFLLLAPLAGTTCVGRCPVGRVRDDPALAAKLAAMVAEAAAVGRARGVRLDADAQGRTLTQIGRLPADMKTSMLHDLEAGRRLELDWLNGAIVRLGRDAGVATPANAEAVQALAPFAQGQP